MATGLRVYSPNLYPHVRNGLRLFSPKPYPNISHGLRVNLANLHPTLTPKVLKIPTGTGNFENCKWIIMSDYFNR